MQSFRGDSISKLTNRLLSRDGRAPKAVLENFDTVIFHNGTSEIDNRASCWAILSDFGNLIAICRKQNTTYVLKRVSLEAKTAQKH